MITNFRSLFVALIASVLIMSCTEQKAHDAAVKSTSANESWGFVGYGGGGAMFHPAVSPHDSKHVFVACDMTGSYVSYNGGESWKMFNLRGPVDYFVFDPHDRNTVYANSIGLFKSVDGGKTWSLFYPQKHEVKGIVSRGDHASELVVTSDSTRRTVHAFTIDPGDSRRMYAVISIDDVVYFQESSDGGNTWSRERGLPEPARNIHIDPTSPEDDRTIWVAGATSIMVRSHRQWEKHGTPSGVKRLTAFAGGYDADRKKLVLYAISGKSYFDPEGDVSGVFYTEDGGRTWDNREAGLIAYSKRGSELPEWRGIATSAGHPQVVYVSFNNLVTEGDTTCLGVARSDDFGKTWSLVWNDKLTPGKNIVASNYKSGWINERFGPTWGENPFSLGVSPVDPDICYGTDFGRTSKTEDGGKTWEQVYTIKDPSGKGWTSRGLEVTTSYGIIFDPFDTSHVFIANTDVGLMESMNGGESWRSATVDNGIPRSWMNSTYWLAFDGDIEGKAWAAMSGTHDLPRPKMFRRNGTRGYKGGIVMTTDAGKTWTPTSSDIGESAITHILIDEKSAPGNRTLYACAFGKGVYKSTDDGKTWQRKNNGIAGEEPLAWRITRRPNDGALFLVVCRRSEDGSIGNSGDGALYRSTDGAETWTRINLPGGTNGPMCLMTNPSRHGQLILSAWGRRTTGKFSPDVGGGIFLSPDEGQTWEHVLSSDQHIHDITFDPRSGRYYACGFNGSAYSSSDSGRSWDRLRGYNFKWGKRVEPDPRDQNKVFVITFGGGVWYGPAHGARRSQEDIVPPQPKQNESIRKLVNKTVRP